MTVFFAMMLVAVLATLGLVIEMGVVTITRDRLQSAADSAAREVLRERDWAVANTPAETDEYIRDYERRERNSRFAPWTFDLDGLEESYEATDQGAGPYFTFTGGSGPTNFGQQFDRNDRGGHSIATLELNAGASAGQPLNEPHGDIVSGEFSSTVFGYGGNPIHLESPDSYERDDFDPSDASSAAYADSVLVRLRRTFAPGQPGNPAIDRDPGISSSGWTLPLIFGGGGLFYGADPAAGYSIRHHGLRFRATAIAEGRPAVRAGLSKPEYGELWEVGVGPITLNARNWDPWDVTDLAWWTEPDGSRAIELKVREYHSLRKVDDDAFLFGVLQPRLARRVGDELEFLPYDDEIIDWYNQPGYGPEFWLVDEIYAPAFYAVYHPGGNGEPPGIRRYITGFFRIRTEIYIDPATSLPVYDDDNPVIPHIKLVVMANEMSDDPRAPWMAPRNASALFDGLQNQGLTPAIWHILVQLLEETPGLVRAPALVR